MVLMYLLILTLCWNVESRLIFQSGNIRINGLSESLLTFQKDESLSNFQTIELNLNVSPTSSNESFSIAISLLSFQISSENHTAQCLHINKENYNKVPTFTVQCTKNIKIFSYVIIKEISNLMIGYFSRSFQGQNSSLQYKHYLKQTYQKMITFYKQSSLSQKNTWQSMINDSPISIVGLFSGFKINNTESFDSMIVTLSFDCSESGRQSEKNGSQQKKLVTCSGLNSTSYFTVLRSKNIQRFSVYYLAFWDDLLPGKYHFNKQQFSTFSNQIFRNNQVFNTQIFTGISHFQSNFFPKEASVSIELSQLGTGQNIPNIFEYNKYKNIKEYSLAFEGKLKVELTSLKAFFLRMCDNSGQLVQNSVQSCSQNTCLLKNSSQMLLNQTFDSNWNAWYFNWQYQQCQKNCSNLGQQAVILAANNSSKHYYCKKKQRQKSANDNAIQTTMVGCIMKESERSINSSNVTLDSLRNCQKCAFGYSLFSFQALFSQQKPYKNTSRYNSGFIDSLSSGYQRSQCYCQIGYFMDSNGNCRLCTGLAAKCQLKIKIIHAERISLQRGVALVEAISINAQFQANTLLEIFGQGTGLQQSSDNATSEESENKVKKMISEYLQTVVQVNDLQALVQQEIWTIKMTSKNSYDIKINAVVSNFSANKFVLSHRVQISFRKKDILSNSMPQNADSSTSKLLFLVASYNNIPPASNSSGLNSSTLQFQGQTDSFQTYLFLSRLESQQVQLDSRKMEDQVMYLYERIVGQIGMSTDSQVSKGIILAAPLLGSSFSIFSFLQTSSILYLINFINLETQTKVIWRADRTSLPSSTGLLKSILKQVVVFRPQNFLTVFGLKKSGDLSGQGYGPGQTSALIQIESISSCKQGEIEFNNLGIQPYTWQEIYYAFPSLSNQSEDYTTLTLNTFCYIAMQVFILEIIVCVIRLNFRDFFAKKINSSKQPTLQKKTSIQNQSIAKHHILPNIKDSSLNQSQNKATSLKQVLSQNEKQFCKRIEYRVQRHCLIDQSSITSFQNESEEAGLLNQKKNDCKAEVKAPKVIQWLPAPELVEKDSTKPSAGHYLRFWASQLAAKRAIFYSSFIMVQLPSVVFLFCLNTLSAADQQLFSVRSVMIDGILLTPMLIVLMFPVLVVGLSDGEALHLLKSVQIIQKFKNYHLVDKLTHSETEWQEKQNRLKGQVHPAEDYSFEQIAFFFYLIYYENIVFVCSIWLGRNAFQQCLPILLFQLFKVCSMWQYFKNIDKLKTVLIICLFSILACWPFLCVQQDSTTAILVIESLAVYLVLSILMLEIFKILKMALLFFLKAIKTKINEKYCYSASENLSSKSEISLKINRSDEQQKSDHCKVKKFKEEKEQLRTHLKILKEIHLEIKDRKSRNRIDQTAKAAPAQLE